MNLWRTLEGIAKPVGLILAFLLLLLFFFYKEAHADVQIEVGAGLLSGEFSQGGALVLDERFVDGKYALGIGYISEQEVTDRAGDLYEVRENLFVFAQRRVCQRWLCLGIGAAHFNGTNRALGSKLTAALSIEAVRGNWSLNIRHFSNAGSSPPNMGQDMLTLGYAFK